MYPRQLVVSVMTTIASEGATVELEKGDEFGIQCAKGKRELYRVK